MKDGLEKHLVCPTVCFVVVGAGVGKGAKDVRKSKGPARLHPGPSAQGAACEPQRTKCVILSASHTPAVSQRLRAVPRVLSVISHQACVTRSLPRKQTNTPCVRATGSSQCPLPHLESPPRCWRIYRPFSGNVFQTISYNSVPSQTVTECKSLCGP